MRLPTFKKILKMNLLRHNPFGSKNHPLNTVVDHLFNGSIADFVGSDFVSSQPSVNVIESDKEFRIELAAPGLKKKDFQLNIEKDQLTISVEKKKEETVESDKFTRREFAFSSFERSFTLSEKVDKNKIAATYENGILNIIIPKKEIEEVSKRSINIS